MNSSDSEDSRERRSGKGRHLTRWFSIFLPCCPNCRSVDFRSVGFRNGFEKAVGRFFLPLRCSLCGRHFFLFRWQVPAGDFV
jgi:hypothetical protein